MNWRLIRKKRCLSSSFLHLVEGIVQRQFLIAVGGGIGNAFDKLQVSDIFCFHINELVVEPSYKAGTFSFEEFFGNGGDIDGLPFYWFELLVFGQCIFEFLQLNGFHQVVNAIYLEGLQGKVVVSLW